MLQLFFFRRSQFVILLNTFPGIFTFFVTCYIKSIQKNVFEVSCKQIVFEAWEETARLAQSVEHETLNLRVVGSSPTLGAAFIDKQILKSLNDDTREC